MISENGNAPDMEGAAPEPPRPSKLASQEPPTGKPNRALLDRAVAYATFGWPVLPVHSIRDDGVCTCGKPECTSPGKHPRTVNGVKDATTALDRIREWWSRPGWENANIALAMGRASGLVAIDVDIHVDKRTGEIINGFDSLAEWTKQHAPLPRTLTSRTGSGWGRHLIYRYPEHVSIGNGVNWLPGVDIRSDGGYIVAPPSLHDSGRSYEWETDLYLPSEPLPEHVVTALRSPHNSARGSGHGFNTAAVLDGLPEGQRDNMLFRFACWARRTLHDDREAVTLVTLLMASRCVPPFPRADAEAKVESAFRQDHDTLRDEALAWSQSITTAGGWDAPLPLVTPAALPAFPIEALPGAVRAMVESVAEATQTPADLPALMAIAAMSAATVGRVRIAVTDDWRESTSVYVLGLANSGLRKTAVVRSMTAPLREVEVDLRDAAAPAIRLGDANIEVLRGVKTAVARKLGKNPHDPDVQADLRQVTLDLAAAEASRPAMPVLILDDATPEAMAAEMARQRERLAIFDAEGGGLLTMAGARYGDAPYLDLLLKAHAGDAVSSSRVGRGALRMEHPTLAMGVLSQPESLRELRGVNGADGRGLISRLLLAVPRDNLGSREVEPAAIEAAVAEQYGLLMRSLVRTLWDREDPVTLRFDRGAYARLIDFSREVEGRLVEDGDLRELGGFGGKIVGAAARYATLHHLGHYGVAGLDVSINDASTTFGVMIARYSIEHFRYAVRVAGWRPELEGAQRVLRWLRKEHRAEFTRRDVQRACGFGTAAEAEGPVALLAEHGFIRSKGQQRRGSTGRTTERFAVNPAVLEDDGQN